MKLCKDCVYHLPARVLFIRVRPLDRCGLSFMELPDRVNGGTKRGSVQFTLQFCDNKRDFASDECGPSGKLWEPK